MDSETYWLIRSPGATTEGPFSMQHIRTLDAARQMGADAIICRKGETEWRMWKAQDVEVEVMPKSSLSIRSSSAADHLYGDEPIYANRQKRSIRAGGSGCAAFVFWILGIAFMLTIAGIPLGLICIAVALLVDSKMAYVYSCGACGNQVGQESQLCPVCHAELRSPEFWSSFWQSKSPNNSFLSKLKPGERLAVIISAIALSAMFFGIFGYVGLQRIRNFNLKQVEQEQQGIESLTEIERKYAAEIEGARLSQHITPNGRKTQMVMIDWKNVGTAPIRNLYADIKPYDASGAPLEGGVNNWCIYAVANSQPGIGPGDTYLEPEGDGYILLGKFGQPVFAARVEVKITQAEEFAD